MKQLLLSAQGEADCPHHLRLAPLHPTSLHPTSLHPSSLHPSSLHPPVNPENDSFTPRPVLFVSIDLMSLYIVHCGTVSLLVVQVVQ